MTNGEDLLQKIQRGHFLCFCRHRVWDCVPATMTTTTRMTTVARPWRKIPFVVCILVSILEGGIFDGQPMISMRPNERETWSNVLRCGSQIDKQMRSEIRMNLVHNEDEKAREKVIAVFDCIRPSSFC